MWGGGATGVGPASNRLLLPKLVVVLPAFGLDTWDIYM
jgi:hypothetical protein